MSISFSSLSIEPNSGEDAEQRMSEMEQEEELRNRGQEMIAAGSMESVVDGANLDVATSVAQSDPSVGTLPEVPMDAELVNAGDAAALTGNETETSAAVEGEIKPEEEIAPEVVLDQDALDLDTLLSISEGVQPLATPHAANAVTEHEAEAEGLAALPETQNEIEQQEATVVSDAASTPKQETKSVAEMDFDTLLNFSAGNVSADDLTLGTEPKANSPGFSKTLAIAADDELDPDSDLLLASLENSVDSKNTAQQQGQDGLGQRSMNPGGRTGYVPNATGQSAGATMMAPGPSGTGAASTLGGIVGQAVGSVITSPFAVLSSAVKHLSQKFSSPSTTKIQSSVPDGPGLASRSLTASAGNTAALSNTLASISQWKCERIEKAADDVIKTSAEITSTPEFLVWQESLIKVANETGRSIADVVTSMHQDEEFAELKAGMDSLWFEHVDKIEAYRKASNQFVRNIEGVKKEFPNSDDQTKNRVTKAMEKVEKEVQFLPGFGESVGEYQRNLAERIRDLVKAIVEFINRLAAKLSGKPAPSQSSENTLVS